MSKDKPMAEQTIIEAMSKEYDKGYKEAIEHIKQMLGNQGGGGQSQQNKSSIPDPRLKNPKINKNSGQSGQSGQSGKSGQSGQNQPKNPDVSKMNGKEASKNASKNAKDASEAAKAAKNAAKEAEKKAKETGDSKDAENASKAKEAAERAKQAAEKAKEAAEKAKEAAKNGNTEEAQNAAKDAQNSSAEAQNAAKDAQRNNQNGQSDNSGNEDESEQEGNEEGWSSGSIDKDEDIQETDTNIWDCTDVSDKVNSKFRDKITGALGDFLDTCRSADREIKEIKERQKEKKSPVKTYAKKAKKAWDVELNNIINAYVADCVQERKREMKHTYQRHNRRQGVVHEGDVIKKGVLPKKDKMDITLTYYIDKSGSMGGGKLENAFRASYAFSKSIMKNNENESIIDDFDFTYYAFDRHFYKIENGKIPNANNDNVDFNEILEYIEKNSISDMINVIITDAQFPINPRKCIEAIKKTAGMFIVVANSSYNQSDFEEIEKALKEKFKFLLADTDFTFSESQIK